MNLAKAIYDALAADPALIAMLAQYNGAPAIFTSDLAPEHARRPYVISGGNVADEPADAKNARGREIHRDIRIYDDANNGGSAARIDAIAERVRSIFHRVRIAIDGFTVLYCDAHGPAIAPTDDTLYGRVVTLRLRLSEN